MDGRPVRTMKGRVLEKQADLKPPETFKKKRKCTECGAKLSRYNPSSRCYSHDDPRDSRILTRHSTRK